MAQAEKVEKHEVRVFSAREALVNLKAKLSIASLTKQDVVLTAVEARMILALTDEKTPWTV